VAFGVDLTALARWLSKSNPTAARQLLQAHGEDIDDGGKRLLARLARQSGNWRQAVRLWQELADKGCSDSLERLAKYHEHVSKDLAAAQRYCERLPADEQNQQRRQRIGRKLAGRQKRLFELPSNIS
jgi:hypothetical protein